VRQFSGKFQRAASGFDEQPHNPLFIAPQRRRSEITRRYGKEEPCSRADPEDGPEPLRGRRPPVIPGLGADLQELRQARALWQLITQQDSGDTCARLLEQSARESSNRIELPQRARLPQFLQVCARPGITGGLSPRSGSGPSSGSAREHGSSFPITSCYLRTSPLWSDKKGIMRLFHRIRLRLFENLPENWAHL